MYKTRLPGTARKREQASERVCQAWISHPRGTYLTVMFMLRSERRLAYSNLPNWPPLWIWAGGNEDRFPKGEVGVLKEVRWHYPIDKCFLWIEYEGSNYLGCLLFGDVEYGRKACELLKQQIGKSLRAIGALEIF
jgi:hypothetical protein